ncbi:quinone oxidoreductase family protein [Variovorax ginsengisoli]|uniref:Zinc-binding alcohol dehydrogenase family protein n=1 Tax=Variovorax ginsengisoli TaxID=363844 RepID=A0ABT8RZ76_9BURK|nr:zinc-binding alcohol dehydrogenase family protein [Variovorax ginsengisoli]MDN8612565.1 zinc-binding alcohol dehydrogenase family protein [Variovorax ginsengisoli]MDO1531735.1 zinc-binding alcohol dehydrogenase family protein [Variovorax ginsengisoli]
MKAMRVAAFGAPPLPAQLAEPQLRAGRTIVRMEAATVGHIDRTVWGGKFLRHPPFPYTPGVEAAGVVVASTLHAVGQRVWLRGSGLGTLFDGTWCELIDAPDEALGLLPDAVPSTLGSAFFSPCTSAWVALHDIARMRAGERVLVTGATGAVGSLAVQLALDGGAHVIAVVGQAAQAAAMPPAAQVLVLGDDPSEALASVSADLLVDTVGGPLLAAALPRVEPGGRAVLVGYTAGNGLALDLAHFLQRDVALLPLNMFRRDAAGRAAAPELLARLADGRLRLDVQPFALEDAAAALDWIAQRGHRGRAVLVARP